MVGLIVMPLVEWTEEIDMEEEVLSFLRGFPVGAILSGVVTAAVILSVL